MNYYEWMEVLEFLVKSSRQERDKDILLELRQTPKYRFDAAVSILSAQGKVSA